MLHVASRSAIMSLLCARHPGTQRLSESQPARARMPMVIEDFRAPSDMLWEQPPEHVLPEELLGPWELRCSISGMSSIWVEFGEAGDCSCSSSIGKGRKWSAEPQRGGAWRVRFVLLDKLSRQLRWEGTVRCDELRGLVVTGTVRGPPKRGASPAEIANGVVIGEFGGFRLE